MLAEPSAVIAKGRCQQCTRSCLIRVCHARLSAMLTKRLGNRIDCTIWLSAECMQVIWSVMTTLLSTINENPLTENLSYAAVPERQSVFITRAACNMARLLSVAAIVLLLLGSNSLTAECRHLRLAGEQGTGLAHRRLLVGRLRSPPICSQWGLANCTNGGRRNSSDVAAASVEQLPDQHVGPSICPHGLSPRRSDLS